MLVTRNALENYLEELNKKVVFNTKMCQAVYTDVHECYGIPMSTVADMVTMRISLSSVTDFFLFALLDIYKEKLKLKGDVLGKFFTTTEIKTYSQSKYEEPKLTFPLEFDMIQVGIDQWIGSISTKRLKQLRTAQIINYNGNTQRVLQRRVKGNKEYYQISLQKNALKAIGKLLGDKTFIPNTLTLNIPEGDDSEFYYDNEHKKLVINKLDKFDIVDGYHRYIALCQTMDTVEDFEFTMELRIVNFGITKARQFIYQEDQKTKMKKIDSNSFNSQDFGNRIVYKLNTDMQSNLAGFIVNSEDGIIDPAVLAVPINYFYGSSKKLSTKEFLDAYKNILGKFNMLTLIDERNILAHRLSFKDLVMLIYCFYRNERFSNEHYYVFCEMRQRQDEINSAKWRNKVIRKPLVNDLERLYDECLKKVGCE